MSSSLISEIVIAMVVYVAYLLIQRFFFSLTFTFEICDHTHSVYTMEQQYSASTMEQDEMKDHLG